MQKLSDLIPNTILDNIINLTELTTLTDDAIFPVVLSGAKKVSMSTIATYTLNEITQPTSGTDKLLSADPLNTIYRDANGKLMVDPFGWSSAQW